MKTRAKKARFAHAMRLERASRRRVREEALLFAYFRETWRALMAYGDRQWFSLSVV
jgi:hypothetical protein